ncbi:unnamed protein product [Phytophthora lilii]|uniref:Unnamed protein product n=1 Tax=Phytophthora lilii TaxID=2077276 RepID=A0A9W7DAW0_9STRA|nr:unnamed protein product [Phytophthora lilii]
MSAIPDFGGSLPKKYKSAAMGDIPALDIKKLFRMVVLGPSFSGKNNLFRHTPISSNKPELVITDDFSNDCLLQKNIFSHYFTRGRHFKLSTIFLSHSYFATDKMIRLNSEYVAILKANSKRDLQLVVKDFNIKGVDERSIVYYYNKATERKGQMLFIDSEKGQIRYNFDRPIVIGN